MQGCTLNQEQTELDSPEPDTSVVINDALSGNAPPQVTTHVEPARVAREVAHGDEYKKYKTEHMAERIASAPASYAAGDMLYLPEISYPQEQSSETYHRYQDNAVVKASEHPVSTFSIDVDTGSYANVRRFLQQGQRPNPQAVRVEEMINYFRYDDAAPSNRETPFSVTTEIAATPWNNKTHLLRIGIRGYDVEKNKLPPANLVFLVDVSGSMQSADKIDLLKSGLKLLVKQMQARDKISLVVYAGNSGVVLEPTSGSVKFKINAAIDSLAAGGSTNGAAGIELAYNMAQRGFIKNGINRILLATDGDFNVGVTDFDQLKTMVETRRQQGVSLTTLGFGTGNYNDQLMEQLADAGNGNYSYIDTLSEARKVLVGEMQSTLMTIAKDVKAQIEFNPAQVSEYRLIGYENRMLQREDFNNDKVDAGEIGAGHSVTALYEISLAHDATRIDDLRYGTRTERKQVDVKSGDELAFVKFRYKLPNEETSRLIDQPITTQQIAATLAGTSESFRFSAAVAAFGQSLRGGKYMEHYALDNVLALARGARGQDADGYRGEFIQLVQLAQSIN
ncbi:MAG: VWA domain-containing protein [Gammaproteobacteria bacterium]|nr:VWA domain-containing protein [Gammaproteobacteria bacterium]